MNNNKETSNKAYDVIIVGGGLSGLSSAYFIKKKYPQLSLLIIEARERIGISKFYLIIYLVIKLILFYTNPGGRTQTIELKTSKSSNKKSKWDIGGQWICDNQTNITKLLKDLKIETYRQHKTGKKVLEVNNKLITYNSSIPSVSLSSLIDLKWIVTKFNIGSRRLNPIFPFQNLLLAHHLDSVNFDQYLYSNSLSSTSRAIMEAGIKSIYGCESNQLNALYALTNAKSIGDGTFETMADLAQDKRVKGGTQQISERLLEYILELDLSFLPSDTMNRKINNRVLIDTQVIEISQNEYNKDGEKVCVLTTKNTRTGQIDKYIGKKVISSIPLNQYVNIKFEPDLPMYKKNVFNNVHSGNLTKFVITYEKPFWRDKGYSGEVISDGSILNLNEDVFNQFYENESGKLTFNKQFPSIGPIVCMYDATNCDDEPALVGFLAGRSSIEWADVDSILRKNEIIDSIVRYFGDEEARNYVDFSGKL